MTASPSQPRRLLIVLEGLQSAVALMRALHYERLFREHPGYTVRYVFRTPPFLSGGRRWHHRLIRPVFVGPAYRGTVRLRERWIARQAEDCDLVYMVGVPSIRLHRKLAGRNRPPLVMDMIDALWLPYHQQFGWQSLDEMLGTADGVICENRYTAEFACRHNRRVHIVPNAPQLDVFDAWRSRVRRDPDRVVLGWVGSPDTAASLYAIWEPLEELFARRPELHLRVVGGAVHRLPPFEKVRYSLLPSYSQHEMVREVLGMDIGLFPLFRVEDSLTRGSSKARIYMAGEAATVCQNWGHSRELIRDGVNGRLADSPQEWLETLTRLIEYPEERRRIAARGLETIRAEYSTEACFRRLVAALDRF